MSGATLAWSALTLALLALAVLATLRGAVVLSRARRMLAASESRYQSLVEQVPGIIYVLELRADQLPVPIYVSPRIEEVIGLPADAWMADVMAMVERVHHEDRERVMDAVLVAHAGGPSPITEFRCVRPDGTEIWLRDAKAIVSQDGDRRYLQGLLLDVTDAKRAASERDRMELDLRLAQKLEAVGQLAAGIAHEINTPTQFVGDTVRFLGDAFSDLDGLLDAYGELLAAAAAGPVEPALVERVRAAEVRADLEYLRERVPGAVERGAEGVERVATIVRGMREFAHPQNAQKGPVDLNKAVLNTLVVATNEYKYVADVETDLGDLPAVVCDGGELNQVFLNLIVNAAHAIADAVGDGRPRGVIRVCTRATGDAVQISISDTGGGIPPGVAERVYDPFFTTKDVGRGTGQGLSIARRIVVERHGGSLSFETALGAGTTFHIVLPIHEDVPVTSVGALAA